MRNQTKSALFALFVAAAICAPLLTGFKILPADDSDATFIDVATISLCQVLESSKLGNNGNGRRPAGRYLKTKYIHNVVQWTHEAAALNPSFGNQREATIKLLAAFYGESRFNPNAVNHGLNKNGTVDRGLTQRNDVHKKPFTKFCKKRNIAPNEIRSEILYAAHINEILTWSYKYESKRADLNFVYYQLKKDVADGMARRGY